MQFKVVGKRVKCHWFHLIAPWKPGWIDCEGDENDDRVVGGSDGGIDVSLLHVGGPCSPSPILVLDSIINGPWYNGVAVLLLSLADGNCSPTSVFNRSRFNSQRRWYNGVAVSVVPWNELQSRVRFGFLECEHLAIIISYQIGRLKER